ncbi:protein FAM227B [Tupaia chinensis]|uniref:protein FAM227B n=1 Tax=Tupaia chinensis TaxID=246437 RepID=UPI0003C8E8DF|nr:protein FAM227B [Tupaia chinensis]XP_006168837.1 protein FAM227B [Tupaia chinensis]
MAVRWKGQWMRRAPSTKMQEPPKSIEEFLKYQNWDHWPREIRFEDNDKWANTLKKVREDSSFISIYTHLWKNVPRLYERLLLMESRLKECSLLLQNHASKIFEGISVIYGTSSYGKMEKYEAFPKKYHYHKKRKIMLSEDMKTEKNIEGYTFSGFKTNELTQLPRHLDAERIFLFILKNHNFDERVFKIWKTHFLSEASIALLQDSFWWWFLHKFKPDRENQDRLFDRISESYVALFMSIPLSRKDAFFQVYPDCLAQAIYATFQEAFPESSILFNDEFKEDLGNNIFLWLSGLKPQKGFWTHWKLKELFTTSIHGSKKAPSKSVKERIASSQERIMTSIDFDIIKILKDPRPYTMSISKEESRLSSKSHYISSGPEFNRFLFNFGSQSPLILYYLKMHEVAGISKAPNRSKIKLTAKFQEPPPAPTYRDIIKEAKKQFAKNQKEFRMEKHRINEEIRLLRQQQEIIDRELDRLQIKATKKPYEVEKEFEKFLNRMRVEAKIEKEFLTTLSSSSSSTEDYSFEREEQEEKLEMSCTQE